MVDLDSKISRFQGALDALVARLEEDRNVLAAVLIGSISRERIWCQDRLSLWVIEADGVTRRRQSDGEDPRVFRTLVEDDVNLSVELVPRTRFKRMVEGASRTAFTSSYFAVRRLVWSRDPSIARWFDQANGLAIRDQRNELLITTTWVVHGLRHARRVLEIHEDVELAGLDLIGIAWSLAAIEVVAAGEIVEGNILYWAMERRPELFDVVYRRVLDRAGRPDTVSEALDRVQAELDSHGEARLAPLVQHLARQGGREVPLSEICDHFAFTQLFPWYLESACEWLVRRGRLEKLSLPYKLTRRSRTDVEEPAYLLTG